MASHNHIKLLAFLQLRVKGWGKKALSLNLIIACLTWEPLSSKLVVAHSRPVPNVLYYESRSLMCSVVIHTSASYVQKRRYL